MTEDGLRAALARPETYRGKLGTVEVRETHISWVFLAGERAYKLKKPLVLPFLDYGTPERRREMCREEVRLNRRLAPDLYLGVDGVARADAGAFELVSDDDPRAIDFVVEMHRYTEARTLAATIARGELTAAQIEAVGRRLARFHAECAVSDTGEGGAMRARRELDRNLEELVDVVELTAERTRIGALSRFLRAFLGSHTQVLDARARRGLIRDTHGDLRAEHVLLGEPVQVVDCVEFDPTLRTLDVADDLAYLVMDLAALGAERFGAILVDAYRAAGGDCGDQPLLSFFAVHRALVRAKVLLVRARQLALHSAAHGHASAQARELLEVGERFSWGARLPLAIAVCGVPASGKTWLAAELARASGWRVLGSDAIRKELAGIAASQRLPESHYSEEVSRATYCELGRRAACEIRARGGVLLDATFRRRVDRDAFREAFGDAAPLVYVECRVPRSVLMERAVRRARTADGISDAGPSVVLRESRNWEPLDELPAAAGVRIRTDRPDSEVRDGVLAMLDRTLGGTAPISSSPQ
jgi:uncharacterized protein